MNQKNIKTHLISFLAGVFVTYIYFDISGPDNHKPRPIERDDNVISSLQKSDLFLNSIQDMMQKQVMDAMDSDDLLNVQTEERDGFYFVTIKAEFIDRDSLDIKIDSQGIAVSGRIEIKTENSISTSTFARSFSLPPGYDTSAPLIENTNENIIIKFKRN